MSEQDNLIKNNQVPEQVPIKNNITNAEEQLKMENTDENVITDADSLILTSMKRSRNNVIDEEENSNEPSAKLRKVEDQDAVSGVPPAEENDDDDEDDDLSMDEFLQTLKEEQTYFLNKYLHKKVEEPPASLKSDAVPEKQSSSDSEQEQEAPHKIKKPDLYKTAEQSPLQNPNSNALSAPTNNNNNNNNDDNNSNSDGEKAKPAFNKDAFKVLNTEKITFSANQVVDHKDLQLSKIDNLRNGEEDEVNALTLNNVSLFFYSTETKLWSGFGTSILKINDKLDNDGNITSSRIIVRTKHTGKLMVNSKLLDWMDPKMASNDKQIIMQLVDFSNSAVRTTSFKTSTTDAKKLQTELEKRTKQRTIAN